MIKETDDAEVYDYKDRRIDPSAREALAPRSNRRDPTNTIPVEIGHEDAATVRTGRARRRARRRPSAARRIRDGPALEDEAHQISTDATQAQHIEKVVGERGYAQGWR